MIGPFVGRSAELSVLARAVAEARARAPRTIVVEGPAGIGKTVLVRRILADLTHAVVLRATGDEIERSLPFGILDQLRASAGAGAVEAVTDPLVAGAAFLELLADLQGKGLVVVVLDDAHWADAPSLQAVAFALRRLRVDQVLALLVGREEEMWRLASTVGRLVDNEAGARLRLGGLTPAELAELADAVGTGSLTAAAARRLHHHTEGNPLHATALLREVGSERLAGGDAGPLPAPRSYAALVLDRLSSCSAATRRLVRAGAVLGTRWPLDLAGGLAGVSDPLRAFEEAAGADLLAAGDGAPAPPVAFAHPLVRAAVYHHLGPGQRAALHTRAAALVAEPGTALRHRTAAATAPDAALAADLRAYAGEQAARRAWAASADAAVAASRLTPVRAEAEQLTVDAIDFLLAAGDLLAAGSLAEEAEAWDDSARRSYVMATTAFFAGRPEEGEALLADAWARCEPTAEPHLAARIAGMNATHHLNSCRGADAVMWARRALEWDPDGVVCMSYPPRLMLPVALAMTCDDLAGVLAGIGLPDLLPDPRPDQVDELLARGVLRVWNDDLAGAMADFAAVSRACRRRGPLTLAINALFYLADSEYRLGHWDDAALHADIAISTAEDAGFVPGLAMSHAVATFVAAARGEPERAGAHARASAEAATDPAQRMWAAVAAARLAQSAGDAHQQAAACTSILDLAGMEPIEDPNVQPWRELYAEALVRLGQLAEAEAVLAPLEARAQSRGRLGARCGASRVRGLIAAAQGDAAGARQCFEAALAAARQAAMPFVQAQVEVDCGVVLRRHGRRRAALGPLLSARSELVRLGAGPLLRRCEQELEALGMGVSDDDRDPVPRLTSQERSVAHLAAGGRANREIAAELMVSVKTVEYHLGNVFAKLHVRSRSQLTARLLRAGGKHY
jgi:DNA-binding CsgD family transcriptional regulator